MLKYLNVRNLHHAYFFEGSDDESLSYAKRFCEEKLGVVIGANPDFWHRSYETFTVDDARELKSLQENRPMGDGFRVFILSLVFMTTEAQNALLKAFEEPTPRTVFFITAPSAAILLPTLRSRLSVEPVGRSGDVVQARKFLSASRQERLLLVKPLAEKGTDEPKKAEALAFLSELEIALHELFKKNRALAVPLREVLLFKRFLFSRAPSIKMLTEHLSLTLPRLS